MLTIVIGIGYNNIKSSMYNPLLQGRCKSDIAFYSAFKSAADDKKIYAFVKGLCFAALLAITIESFLKNEDLSPNLLQTVIFDIAVSAFGMLFEFYQVVVVYSRPHQFLAMAEARGHIVLGEQIAVATRIEDCVSGTVFLASENIREADVDQLTKKTYIRSTKRAVTLSIAQRFGSTVGGERFHSLISVTSLIMSIITVAQEPMTGLYQPFLITYIVLIGLSELVLIVLMIIVVLVPVFCCLFCVYCCCCKTGGGGQMNVAEKLATMQDIRNVEGNCSICYQNIALNQIIVVLPCNQKHLFHKECITHWARVKLTCPICRAEIPTGGPVVPSQPPIYVAQPAYDQ